MALKFSFAVVLRALCTKRKRSMNPTCRKMRPSFTVAFPVNSSMATALHNLQPTAHGAAAPVRGAAMYSSWPLILAVSTKL